VLPPTPIKHHAFLSFCETQLCFPLETPLSFPRLAHFGLNASFPLWAAFEWETLVSFWHPKVKPPIITSLDINTPSLSLSLFHFSSSSSSLFPAASNREQGEKLLLPPLATIISTTPSSSNTTIFFNLSPSLCEGRPLLLVWGRVLLRWQDLGPVPSFWFGTELLHRGFPVIVRDYSGDHLVTILAQNSSSSLGTLAGPWTHSRRVSLLAES